MKITYTNDCTVEEIDSSLSLLQISLKHEIPHTHVCGGNARCSTCRILVLKGAENLEPRNEAETALALRKGFTDDIRVACQTRAHGDVTVRRLVIDQDDIREIVGTSIHTTGREMNLAILFSDIRSFTPFSENHLPYDVVHILNRYFNAMGEVILRNGGIIDKYIGDGLMAIFGLNSSDARTACLNAVRAGSSMLAELEHVNRYLQRTFQVNFNIGVGVHYGEMIVGEMGHPKKVQFTALGDNVNMASRIESATKKAGVPFLISDAVYEHVKDQVTRGKVFSAPLKGKTGRFKLYEIVEVAPGQGGTSEQYQLPLLQKMQIAQDTWAFLLDTSLNDYAFEPGQFADLTLPEMESVPGQSTRTFSIASSPDRSDALMFVSRMRNSPFKNALMKLPEGAPIFVSPAMGEMTIKNTPAPLAFIAGGIGITPFHSMVSWVLKEKPGTEVYLFYSIRSLELAAFLDEFETYAAEFPNFHFIPTLTEADSPGWKYERGRIDKVMIRKYVPRDAYPVFYVAGPSRMVTGMRELLVQMGVFDHDIHSEEFLGY